jgi:hypothetical protein
MDSGESSEGVFRLFDTSLTDQPPGRLGGEEDTNELMRHTNELENEITSGASYLDCFKGTDLRRTEIVCMVWAIQNLSGNAFSNYSTYFPRPQAIRPQAPKTPTTLIPY